MGVGSIWGDCCCLTYSFSSWSVLLKFDASILGFSPAGMGQQACESWMCRRRLWVPRPVSHLIIGDSWGKTASFFFQLPESVSIISGKLGTNQYSMAYAIALCGYKCFVCPGRMVDPRRQNGSSVGDPRRLPAAV